MTLMRSLWGTSSEQVRGRCVEINCSGHLNMLSLNVPGSVVCKALLDLDAVAGCAYCRLICGTSSL